jgi:hypothetical protein
VLSKALAQPAEAGLAIGTRRLGMVTQVSLRGYAGTVLQYLLLAGTAYSYVCCGPGRAAIRAPLAGAPAPLSGAACLCASLTSASASHGRPRAAASRATNRARECNDMLHGLRWESRRISESQAAVPRLHPAAISSARTHRGVSRAPEAPGSSRLWCG